ncbi:hypothetical protein LCGC14_0821490 [marine sediment metagenome]|uniref:Uncharacterized protein n=1 Tax=marine sediment metagenome TaxID=412755 RepID=A0A0F9PNC2_9ZZZZ
MSCPNHPAQTEGDKCPKCGSKIEKAKKLPKAKGK